MKRAALALLAFLGVACIAAAIAVPTYLVPKLKVVPLDLDITSIATSVPTDGDAGNRFPVTILDRCSVTASKAATLDAHLTQQRRSVIIDPSNSDQATLQSGQTLQIDRTRDAKGKEREPSMASTDGARKCNGGLLNATVDRVSVNRKTAAPNGNVSSLQVDPVSEGGNVDESSVKIDDRKGFQYKFGFDVKKRDYYYYDTTTRQDAVAKFVEEKTIDGVKTYHFRADVPERDLSDLPNPAGEASLGTILNMPAKWWGIRGKGVKSKDLITMHRYAKAVRNVYVEPTTGTIIYGEEDQEQYFRSPDQSDDVPAAVSKYRLTALQGRFAWDEKTVAAQASRADDYLGQLRTGGVIVPIILGILGAILLLAWAVLVWLGRRRGKSDPPADGEPAVPVDDGQGPDDGDGSGDGAYGEGGYGDGAYSAEQTTVLPASAGGTPYDEATPDTTAVLPPVPEQPRPDDSSTQAFQSPYARPDAPEPPVESPADVTDTEAFRAPADEFSPYTTDPTRPMPDFDRYRRGE